LKDFYAKIAEFVPKLVKKQPTDMTAQDFIKFDHKTRELICQGNWTLANIPLLEKIIKHLSLPTSGDITIDGQKISKIDSSGAWIISKWSKKITERGLTVHTQNFSEQHQKLLSLIQKKLKQKIIIPEVKAPGWLARLGKGTIERLKEIRDFFAFIGILTLEIFRLLGQSRYIRWRELTGMIYKTGYQALPIIALLSFMIGVVLAHQTGTQLQKYGASIFIVDLIGFSILREFGPLITAIMVAARSGSAFTAQLGIMKINQEIDALNTMGITPTELLWLPRIIALVIVLPLLTMWANVFGIIGGMLTTAQILNISWIEFLDRFQHEVPLRELLMGLAKTPVFALIIAIIGCFEAMEVERNADSVGRLTTRSVVLSIFFIVVADTIFSVIFAMFKL
jgi:phospholipid/cholesterol/gamma-HCH transport system permease protein